MSAGFIVMTFVAWEWTFLPSVAHVLLKAKAKPTRTTRGVQLAARNWMFVPASPRDRRFIRGTHQANLT
jgi:hypothetical protein